MNIGIYKITSPSGKVYIGQSINIEKRFKEHRNSINQKQTKLYKSFQKYGYINHKFEIIEECDLEQLNEREIYWKQYHLNLVNNDWKLVLFHELYDAGGGPKSKNTKQKIGLANSGPKPEGFGLKISRSISQYDLKGNFIKKWNSITEAKQVYSGDITSCCLGKQKTASGFIWRYFNNTTDKIEVNLVNKHKNIKKSENWIKNKYKPVLQYDLEGNFIKEWESIKQIIETLNYSQSGISNCCRGLYKQAYNYIWKFK